jgi:hypothetical protein
MGVQQQRPVFPIAEARMLDRPETFDLALLQRYGHLLPDSLIRHTVDAAPAAHVAQADLAALADAVRRAPEGGTAARYSVLGPPGLAGR